ncbi:hypothetical protein C5167_040795 [Papaver somniferum]|uniref:Uncharacterized protein n=1 Tax=Papaver somniferum TaxID=3469 RepID=A0A4Y7IK51_PAPSO|nr:hypothetical protein C5167_040795 [Papaver somniferum]
MDRHFLCMVIRGTDACPYQVTTKPTVDELKAHVCSYWNNILPDSIQFVFDYEGRSNVVDSDVKLCSFLSLCIVNQLSFLELRLFERVPLRAPDFVREPTTSEFSLAPDPSRDQLVNPCHLPSSSRMSEFSLVPDPSRDQLVNPCHLPSSSRMSEFCLAPDPRRAQLVNPCHLPSSSRMSEFRLAPDPSRAQLVNPCHLPSSSRMSEFR